MAINCDVSSGITEIACKNGVSGLKNLFLINYSDDYDFSVTSDDIDGHVITDMGVTASVTESFKIPLKNTGNTYEEPIESSRDNSVTVFNQTLNFIIGSISPEKHFLIKRLSWGRPLIVVENNSGEYFLIGKERGCEISGAVAVEGELNSFNGYRMVAEAQEREPAYFLTESAVTQLLATVSANNV